jgi:hypothetical protein
LIHEWLDTLQFRIIWWKFVWLSLKSYDLLFFFFAFDMLQKNSLKEHDLFENFKSQLDKKWSPCFCHSFLLSIFFRMSEVRHFFSYQILFLAQSCADLSPTLCSSMGYLCNNNFYQSYMASNCPLTCQLCTPVPTMTTTLCKFLSWNI